MMGPLVLPADVQIVPFGELPPQVRSQIQGGDSDFALTRPHARTPSKIVDAAARELIERFRKPVTIADAIVSHGKAVSRKPSELLEDAYPLIQSLLAAKLLVEPGGHEAETIAAKLTPGDRHGEWEVAGTVQALVDTELHRVKNAAGQHAALKLLRDAAPKHVRRSFAHEAAILRSLEGAGVAPRLLESSETHVVTEWCEGVEAAEGAAGNPQVCAALAEAYAKLHEAGVLHGDVHPRNAIVLAGSGGVRLIDFGLATRLGPSTPASPRAGVAFFSDPELARAALAGALPPPVTAASEQYSVAALLYYFMAGRHYVEFSVEREPMLRQIAEAPPAPTGNREIDAVLLRALEKEPATRFASMAEFAAAFRAAVDAPAPATAAGQDAFDEYVDQAIARLADPLAPPAYEGPAAPSASVTYGAAGIALAILRIAQARGSARLLALADRWADRATSLAGSEPNAAFYHDAVQITPETVGRVSPYHTGSGIAAVNAELALAYGDRSAFEQWSARFIELSTAEPCTNLDVTLGRSGTVLVAATLIDAARACHGEAPAELAELGNRTMAGIWQELDALPPIADERQIGYLGMAHGWAGLAYTALRWNESTGAPPPAGLAARLAQLAECAQPTRHGLHWPARLHPQESFGMKGWCNGGAGHVFLWTLAHRLLGGAEFARLAEATALDVFHAAQPIESLCCGLAGAAYSLLALHRHSGESAWLNRARTLAARVLGIPGHRGESLPNSLYKGQTGVAALAAQLAQPELAAMPMFESGYQQRR